MQQRRLGGSGLQVPVLALGAMTFNGDNPRLRAVGTTGLAEATRQVDRCLDAGVRLFDTADVYGQGESERILGQALGKRRPDALIATKAVLRSGPGPFDAGASRRHLIEACDGSLRRLGTDWIDLYQLHGFDALTPLEETLDALATLQRQGKVRYLGVSNYPAWQLMKALALADASGLPRFVSHQLHYSLVNRDAEHELLPLGLDQQVGSLVWSPLAFGFLSGKFERGAERDRGARLGMGEYPFMFDWEKGFAVLDVVREIAAERRASPAQVALNWLAAKPTIASILIGARTEAQLADNLAAAAWSLSAEEVARLDAAGPPRVPYPQWHQRAYAAERNPPLPGFVDHTGK